MTNVDRTARNPNLLMWHKRLWLIDHGAALFFHHSWNDFLARSRSRFPQIREHVLLPFASDLPGPTSTLSARLTPELIYRIVALVPDEWLDEGAGFATPAAHRTAYADFLLARLEGPRLFVEEALHARDALV